MAGSVSEFPAELHKMAHPERLGTVEGHVVQHNDAIEPDRCQSKLPNTVPNTSNTPQPSREDPRKFVSTGAAYPRSTPSLGPI